MCKIIRKIYLKFPLPSRFYYYVVTKQMNNNKHHITAFCILYNI